VVTSFTTGVEAALVRPNVIATDPASGANNVPMNSTLVLHFDHRVDPLSVNAGTVHLFRTSDNSFVSPSSIVAAADGMSANWTGPLLDSTQYRLTWYDSGIVDLAGNGISGGTIYFTTAPILVSVSPTNAALQAGRSQQFIANVINASNSAINWSISPADAGTIDSTGLYTAPASVPAQPVVTITASSVLDPNAKASALVSLYAPATFIYRRALSIDHTKVPNTDQNNFPVLVSGTYSYLATVANGGKVQNANGYDIIFSSDPAGTVKLDHEIESYDPATGKVNFWVRVPTLSHTTDTTIYMQYGASSISSSEENRAGVWDGNFQGVWHLGGGSSLSAADSTAGGHNGTIFGATPTAGEIAGAASFPGSGQYIDIGNMGPRPMQGTISMWVNAPVRSSYPNSFQTGGGGCGNAAFRFELNSDGGFGAATGNSSCAVNGPGFTSSLSTNQWHQTTVVWDSSTGTETSYYDGKLVQTISNTFWPDNFDDVRIGDGFNYRFWNGGVDEVRMSSSIRSGDWIATEYKNQTSPASFYSLGSEFTDVGVSPGTVSLGREESQQFSAVTVDGSSVNWSIAPPGAGSISNDGLYTAPVSVPAPEFITVTATSTGNSSHTGSATVTLNPPYSFSRAITINHAQVPNTDQNDFPVLISGTYSYLATVANGGKAQNANGYDIIFTSDAAGNSKLDHEIDSYNSVTGAVNFWVRVSNLSHTADTTIYMWYGNSAITTSQENQTGVWSNGYAGVWHFGRSSLSVNDSTANANNAINNGVTGAIGVFGEAGSFDGTGNTYFRIPSSDSFKPPAALTLEAWVNPVMATNWSKIFSLDYAANGSWQGPVYALGLQSTTLAPRLDIYPTGIGGPSALPAGQWSHMVGTYDGRQSTIYLNGVQVAAAPQTGAIHYGNSQDLSIGNRSPYTPAEAINGLIDEARISIVARSPDWIATEYNNQSAPSTFYSVGPEN
jgi:hypothetical protein